MFKLRYNARPKNPPQKNSGEKVRMRKEEKRDTATNATDHDKTSHDLQTTKGRRAKTWGEKMHEKK